MKTACRALYLFMIVLCLTSCESRRTIVNGLDEKEANEILVFLAAKDIDASKVAGGDTGNTGGAKLILWNITVPSDRAVEAMALLNQAGLPRRRGQNLLGIFSSVGLVPSEMQEQIRYQAGLAEQIASTIRKMDGVLDADVQISFPKEDPLNPTAKKGKITASVYVKHNGILDDPNAHMTSKIKRLVAGSITGLNYDDVTVIGDRAAASEYTRFPSASSEEEKTWVKVWSLVIAKDSLSRFRLIFFSFSLLILLMLLALIWTFWKIYPLLRSSGGFHQLFNIHPIEMNAVLQEQQEKIQQLVKSVKEASKEDEKDKDKDKDKDKEKPKTPEENGTAGKNIDETT